MSQNSNTTSDFNGIETPLTGFDPRAIVPVRIQRLAIVLVANASGFVDPTQLPNDGQENS
jgi:hypothetical protein